MGKLSTTNKRNRLLQELKMHMNLKVSGSKTALNLDYLEPLRDAIIEPLVSNGTGGVPTSIEKLENYCLRREDIESIIELTLWSNQKDPMSRVESKVKAALTRAYNKEGFCLPYSLGTVTKGKKGKPSADDLVDGEGLEEDLTGEEEAEDDDDIAADAMIKAKKKTTKKVAENQTKAKTKGNKSKKNETQKEEKESKKKTKVIRIESDSESESQMSSKKGVKPEVKHEVKKVVKEVKSKTNDNKSIKTNGSEETPKNKTKTETKPKKTPENQKIDKKESISSSKSRQPTLQSFFKKK